MVLLGATIAMKNVTRSLIKQSGISLIELLVSSSIGLIALGVVGSVFISGNKLASERTKELMLAQDINDAINLIKTDAQRAGYNSDNTGSLVLSGSTSTIVVAPANDALSYIYEDEDNKWRVVRFFLKKGNPDSLQMCLDIVSKGTVVTKNDASCSKGTVAKLLDPSYITTTNFSVIPTKLATSEANTTLLNISITAKLKKSSYSKKVSTTIKARNWN